MGPSPKGTCGTSVQKAIQSFVFVFVCLFVCFHFLGSVCVCMCVCVSWWFLFTYFWIFCFKKHKDIQGWVRPSQALRPHPTTQTAEYAHFSPTLPVPNLQAPGQGSTIPSNFTHKTPTPWYNYYRFQDGVYKTLNLQDGLPSECGWLHKCTCHMLMKLILALIIAEYEN